MGRKKKTELDLMRDSIFRKHMRQRQALQGPFVCPKCGIDPKIKTLYMSESNHNESFLIPPKGTTLSEWVRQQEAYEEYLKKLKNLEEGEELPEVKEPKKGKLRHAKVRTIRFYCDSYESGCSFRITEKYAKVSTNLSTLKAMAPEINWLGPADPDIPQGLDRYCIVYDKHVDPEEHKAQQVLLRPQENIKVVKLLKDVSVMLVEPPKPERKRKVKGPRVETIRRARMPPKIVDARINEILKEMRE